MENAIKSSPTPSRLSITEIRNEVLSYFNIEKGLLFTIIYMIKRPENLIALYLNENRRKVFNPLRYLLFAVAVSTIVTINNPGFISMIEGLQQEQFSTISSVDSKLGINIWETMLRMQEIFLSYQNVVILFSIPLISWITWKFLNKQGFNFAENLAINCFVYGTNYWISVIAGLFHYLFDYKMFMYFLTLLSFGLVTYLYSRIFKAHPGRAFLGAVINYIPFFLVGVVFQFFIFIVLILT